MKILNINIKKKTIVDIVYFISVISIMYYGILSARNLLQVLLNITILTQNASILGVLINSLLYVAVIACTLNVLRSIRNPNNVIIALLIILLVY